MAFSLHAGTRLLVVAPHPDDESIATGELIQQVRQVGGQVDILLLTHGDNNPWPQRWMERRFRILHRSAPRDHPGGEIGCRQAAARRRDIAMGDEGRIDHPHPRLHHPGLGGQVGAGRQIADQAQLRQQQRA